VTADPGGEDLSAFDDYALQMTDAPTARNGAIEPKLADDVRSARSAAGGIELPADSLADLLEGPLPNPRFDPDLSLDDDGNARRLVRDWGRVIRYPHGLGWHLCRGSHWDADATEHVVELARVTARRILLEAGVAVQQGGTLADEAALSKHAQRSKSERAIAAMLRLARADQHALAIRPEQLDADPWALNVANGTLDLRTGALRNHSREDLFTHLVPIAYDKEATAPRWERFLLEVCGDVDLALYLQRAVGYTLTGLTTEQVLFLLYGTGANGKTTALEIIRKLLGGSGRRSLAIAASFETLLHQERRGGGESASPDLARMAGRRLVVAVEADAGRRLNEERIKALTGTDTISARRLYQDSFEFVPVLKLWLGCNHRPIIRGADKAIWRRVKLIPFTVTFGPGTLDPNLPATLDGELPGILRWAVEGALAWQREGLGEAKAVTAATEGYREDSDVLGEFLSDRCALSEHAWVSSSDLHATYRKWSEDRGETPMGQRLFALRLEERTGIRKHRKDSGRGWAGVSVKEGHHASSRGFGGDS